MAKRRNAEEAGAVVEAAASAAVPVVLEGANTLILGDYKLRKGQPANVPPEVAERLFRSGLGKKAG